MPDPKWVRVRLKGSGHEVDIAPSSFKESRHILLEDYPPNEDDRPRRAKHRLILPPAVALPPGNASTEEHRAFAVEHGMSAEQAAELGRAELRDEFTPTEGDGTTAE